MSSQVVNEVVNKLVRIGKPDVASFESVLATTFKPVKQNPYWTFYESELATGPFSRGELRLNKAGDQVLLNLMPRENLHLTENDLELRQWGAVANIDVNPRIPPEGTDTYLYNVNGVSASFQLTHNSRQLHGVTLEWGVPA